MMIDGHDDLEENLAHLNSLGLEPKLDFIDDPERDRSMFQRVFPKIKKRTEMKMHSWLPVWKLVAAIPTRGKFVGCCHKGDITRLRNGYPKARVSAIPNSQMIDARSERGLGKTTLKYITHLCGFNLPKD